MPKIFSVIKQTYLERQSNLVLITWWFSKPCQLFFTRPVTKVYKTFLELRKPQSGMVRTEESISSQVEVLVDIMSTLVSSCMGHKVNANSFIVFSLGSVIKIKQLRGDSLRIWIHFRKYKEGRTLGEWFSCYQSKAVLSTMVKRVRHPHSKSQQNPQISPSLWDEKIYYLLNGAKRSFQRYCQF